MTERAIEMIPLADFIVTNGRLATAKLVGCTGPALANALRSGRQVWVIDGEDPKAFEISPFPGKGKSVEHRRGTQGLQEDISSILKKGFTDQGRPHVRSTSPVTPSILLTG